MVDQPRVEELTLDFACLWGLEVVPLVGHVGSMQEAGRHGLALLDGLVVASCVHVEHEDLLHSLLFRGVVDLLGLKELCKLSWLRFIVIRFRRFGLLVHADLLAGFLFNVKAVLEAIDLLLQVLFVLC